MQELTKVGQYKDITVFFNPEKCNFIATTKDGVKLQSVSYQSLCAKITKTSTRLEKVNVNQKLKNQVVSYYVGTTRESTDRYKTGVMTGNWKKNGWETRIEIVSKGEAPAWIYAGQVYLGDVAAEMNKVEEEFREKQQARNLLWGKLQKPKLAL